MRHLLVGRIRAGLCMKRRLSVRLLQLVARARRRWTWTGLGKLLLGMCRCLGRCLPMMLLSDRCFRLISRTVDMQAKAPETDVTWNRRCVGLIVLIGLRCVRLQLCTSIGRLLCRTLIAMLVTWLCRWKDLMILLMKVLSWVRRVLALIGLLLMGGILSMVLLVGNDGGAVGRMIGLGGGLWVVVSAFVMSSVNVSTGWTWAVCWWARVTALPLATAVGAVIGVCGVDCSGVSNLWC